METPTLSASQEAPIPAPATEPPKREAFAPVAANERIEALDVVRGFALIGIFLMNIEYFNRAMSSMGEGLPRSLTGIDWLAGAFVYFFVQGKFWTIFSLLFGMGFAVMLTRAERAGREFLAPYLRRILALAVFGAAHYIFFWGGDILFSYAVAAGALLILLHGNWKYILAAMAVTVGLGLIPGLDNFFAFTSGLAIVLLASLYLRGERLFSIRGHKVPLISLLLGVPGVLLTLGAIVLWVLPNAPKDPRVPLTILGPVLTLLAYLSARYREPEKRSVRLAVTLYVLVFTLMTLFGIAQYLKPAEPEIAAVQTTAAAEKKDLAAPASAPTASTAAPPAPPPADAKVADAKPAEKKDVKKPEKTEAEKAAERKAQKEKRLKERDERISHEIQTLSKGPYKDAVLMRAAEFPDKAAGDAGFAAVLIGMFLLGSWFVRSGIMENTGQHLDFFRKLAYIGLPLGIGIGIAAGAMFTVSHIPGDEHDGSQIAQGLMMLGNLPACLGYVGLVVLMLHSNTVFSKIRVLAPVGRMALTNYLTQTLVCTLYFYGYGLGHWGMPRAQQFLFVAVVYAAQVVFSHWWLARFRYGPMEWLWRGFTYRQIPRLRIDSMPAGAAGAAA